MPISSSIACTAIVVRDCYKKRLEVWIYQALNVSWWSTFVARRSSLTGIPTMSSTDARPSTLPML